VAESAAARATGVRDLRAAVNASGAGIGRAVARAGQSVNIDGHVEYL